MRKSVLSVLIPALCAVALMGCDTNGTTNIIKSRPDVVVIGDSIFALSGETEKFLYELSGETFRSYAVSGSEMTGGFVTTVPAQWDQAVRADSDIKTVIMDGGGNDVLVSGQLQCSGFTVTQICKNLLQDEVIGPFKKLVAKMKNAGVETIIYQGYYVTTDATKTAVNLYSQEVMADVCADLGVHYVSTRAAFEGHSNYIKADGIHPTTAGSRVLANLLWDEMQQHDW